MNDFLCKELLFLGRRYPVVINEDLPKAVVMEDSFMISSMVLGNIKDHLECWYKSQAFEYFSQRVNYYAGLTGLKYKSIKVGNARTRWGSCGYQDTLNFTWKLIMAPVRVVDYVVIHELMHLKQKNHSSQFWAEVSNICPEYKQDDRWLRRNGHLLTWDHLRGIE